VRTWFKRVDQLSMNVGDPHYDPLFPFGFGLITQTVKGEKHDSNEEIFVQEKLHNIWF